MPRSARLSATLARILLNGSGERNEGQSGRAPWWPRATTPWWSKATTISPPIPIKPEHLLPSNTKTMCCWKGQASYHTLFVNGDANPDAVWYYPDPQHAAANIKGRVAFWKGVQVIE